MASQFVIGILGFVFWLVAARFFSPTDVGLATALISAVLLLCLLARLGLDIGVIRFLAGAPNRSDMINTCLTVAGLSSLVVAVAFLLGLDLWSPELLFVRNNLGYATLFVVFTVVVNLTGLFQDGIFVALRATQFSLATHGIIGLRLLLLPFLGFLGAYGIFSSWGLAYSAAFLCGMVFIARTKVDYRPKIGIRGQIVLNMLRFSLANHAAEIMKWLPTFVLPLVIVNVFGPDMGAYFYVAWIVASMLFAVPYSVGFSLLAEGSYQPEKIKSDTARAARFTYLLIIPIALFLFFAGDRLLSLVGGSYSDEAFDLLRILSLSAIPVAFNSLHIAVSRIRRQTIPVICFYGFPALVTIGVGYILVERMGLSGIGVAWISSQLAVSLAIGFSSLRKHMLRA